MSISQESLDKLQKAFGKESVMRLSDKPKLNIGFIPTGSIKLDAILGGGFPKGRIIEIYGPESSGKTTTAIQAIAEGQREGLNAGFIDVEHAFDPSYAKQLGVNVDELLISQPDNAEQALDLAIAMIETGEIQIVVVDSTNALVPKAELEGEMGDNNVALQARLLSKAMRKITGIAQKNDCLVIFISQIRIKVGVMFGSPESVGVGNALKYYASQRLDIRRGDVLKDKSGTSVGHIMRFKTVKNKVFPPYKNTEVTLAYGIGYDTLSEILDIAVDMDIVKKSGSWFSYGETRLGQGKDSVLTLFEDNPELVDEIRSKIYNK